jgi:hypothetical protein
MKHMNRFVTGAAAAAFAASALLAPAAAQAVPILATTTANNSCEVTGGELKWGVKEGFRSYISGTIANGSWQVADGANYETPLFSWSNPSGAIDAATGEGSVSFAGSIHFSGHDGVLNLHIANPTVVLNGDGTANLLLDTKSNNAQGELVVDEQQAYLGKVEGLGQLDPASGALNIDEAPVVLTADGATAFGGFYASGDELDPVSLSLQLGPCEGTPAAPAATEEAGEEAVLATQEQKSEVPWLPIAIGGVAVLVIAITGGMLIAGRKTGPAAGDVVDGAGDAGDGAAGAGGAGGEGNSQP